MAGKMLRRQWPAHAVIAVAGFGWHEIHIAEFGFTSKVKNIGDTDPGYLCYQLIAIDKFEPQLFCQTAANHRFAATHQPDKCNRFVKHPRGVLGWIRCTSRCFLRAHIAIITRADEQANSRT